MWVQFLLSLIFSKKNKKNKIFKFKNFFFKNPKRIKKKYIHFFSNLVSNKNIKLNFFKNSIVFKRLQIPKKFFISKKSVFINYKEFNFFFSSFKKINFFKKIIFFKIYFNFILSIKYLFFKKNHLMNFKKNYLINKLTTLIFINNQNYLILFYKFLIFFNTQKYENLSFYYFNLFFFYFNKNYILIFAKIKNSLLIKNNKKINHKIFFFKKKIFKFKTFFFKKKYYNTLYKNLPGLIELVKFFYKKNIYGFFPLNLFNKTLDTITVLTNNSINLNKFDIFEIKFKKKIKNNFKIFHWKFFFLNLISHYVYFDDLFEYKYNYFFFKSKNKKNKTFNFNFLIKRKNSIYDQRFNQKIKFSNYKLKNKINYSINNFFFNKLNLSFLTNLEILIFLFIKLNNNFTNFIFYKLFKNNKFFLNLNNLQNIFFYNINNFFFYLKSKNNFFSKTNIIPFNYSFNYSFKRFLIKTFNFRKFSNITTPYHYFTIIKFLEFCSGKKIYFSINSFFNNLLSSNENFLCLMWSQKVKFFRKVLGPRLFLSESLQILYTCLKHKDPYILSNWILQMLYKISFWKYKLFFRYIQYVLRYFFWTIVDKLQIKGLKFQLKGKVSVAGNARTRTVLNKMGITGHSTFNNKILYDLQLVRTFTGVIGFKTWLFF